MNETKRKVQKDTIIRTILLGLAIVNQILAIMGKDKFPFTEDEVYQGVSLIFTVVTTIRAWWKNNSFTQSALIGDEVMEQERVKNKI